MKYIHAICGQEAFRADHTLPTGVPILPTQVVIGGIQPAIGSKAACGFCGLPLGLGGVKPYNGIHVAPFDTGLFEAALPQSR